MSPLRILVVGAGVGGISIARGLLRDGHDVTVFEKRPDAAAGGGAVTIWSNGSTVLAQLGVDMTGAGQLISAVRVVSSAGRRLANFDVTAVVNELGAPVRMVPRRVLLERSSPVSLPIASDTTVVSSQWSVHTTEYGSNSTTAASPKVTF